MHKNFIKPSTLLLLLAGAPVIAAGPNNSGLDKLSVQLETQYTALSKITDDMARSGPLCQATYFGASVGPRAAAELKLKKAGTDGASRDVPATIRFQRDRIVKAIATTSAAIEAAAAKAETDGNGAPVAKVAAANLADLDKVIAAEAAQSQATVAAGMAAKSGYFGEGALAAVREQTVDPNCQVLIRAIDGSDSANAKILATMDKMRAAAKAYAKSAATFAAEVKKPAPPPAPPAPPPPAAVAPKPAPAAPKPAPAAPAEAPKAEAPKAEPPKPAPVAPAAAPKTFGAAILSPGFDAPLNYKIIEEAPKPTEPAPAPEICEENTNQASTLPILNAVKAAEALKAPPLPPVRPTDLQLRIAVESAGGEPLKKGIVPYDSARDIWGSEQSIPWKKYDREKRAMGILVAPAVSDKQFAAVVAKLGKPLSTLEARVRLQKAINALAMDLDKGKARSPTVFQDGVLGSRTKNAVVYHFEKNPAAFLRALKQQGFRPDW